jgi:hypothetical protein
MSKKKQPENFFTLSVSPSFILPSFFLLFSVYFFSFFPASCIPVVGKYYCFLVHEISSRATLGSPAATGCLSLVAYPSNVIRLVFCFNLLNRTSEGKRYHGKRFFDCLLDLLFMGSEDVHSVLWSLPPNRFLKILPGAFVICRTLNHRHSRDYTAIWRHRPMCDTNHVNYLFHSEQSSVGVIVLCGSCD